MKKILLLSVSLLCGFVFNLNAQDYIRFDASIYSEALEMVKKVDVYIPGDYYLHPDQKYATIYYLHGAGGDQNSGFTEASLYYQKHAQDTNISSPPAIFVCPDGSCEPYMGSMWLNSPLYGSYEDFVMQDVIGFVEENFRAIPEKNFRAICGLSMGGCGSAWLGINYPDSFRVCFPYIGGVAMPDTTLNAMKSLLYNENGSYTINYNAGFTTQVYMTILGGWLPNMEIPPYYIELPYDTLGNWIDTTLAKVYKFDCSRKVKDLSPSDSLAWFLGAGTTDYMINYPGYLIFIDSLIEYGIEYKSHFFSGGHEYNEPTWIDGLNWIDSIFNQSFADSPYLINIDPIDKGKNSFSVYPNPFSEFLDITCQFTYPSPIKIDILDIRGETLFLLKEEKQQRGIISYQFNLSEYPSGIYFIKLDTNQGIITEKLIKL